ncbi:SAM-dependent methyltransferase, MidA family [Thermostaphylospora chromogena]|uniref:SAM-dependent methyltransferase, MidA family n=1 Tax=Thermostaphylospora chromogena TaxID=35622 RepID=A0A1H1C5K8_9ACTN|nr:SAM-dependent methyltransferase [Thermostaphylospora chromogena]SDQ59340.1 SAM-dependent methyltransferase, MidA family [Thermostaphylospora chromogena]
MWLTWRAAMERALYGPGGFYLRERPSGHFRTSVNASPVFAEAMLAVLTDVDARLGHPPRLDLVDMGAGEGALVSTVLALAPPDLARRLRVTAVDLAPRPAGLAEEIVWTSGPPDSITGLVVANEWLDNVPLDVVERTERGPRLVEVDSATGRERLGPPPHDADLEWLERWWPLTRVGQRAEVGRTRDEAWASVIRRIARGRAIAVDYAHFLAERPPCGTLTGYRDGVVVPPVPDGSCDITAHVALDACAEAGRTAGPPAVLTTQRAALSALGFDGRRPALETARSDPRGYLRALTRASQEAELINPDGLGGFIWLCQDIDR